MMEFVTYLIFALLPFFHQSVSYDFNFQQGFGQFDITENENITILRRGTYRFNCTYNGAGLTTVDFVKSIDEFAGSRYRLAGSTREQHGTHTNWTVQVATPRRIDAYITNTAYGIRMEVVLRDIENSHYFCRYTSQEGVRTAKSFTVQFRGRVTGSVRHRLSAVNGAEVTLPCKFLTADVNFRHVTWSKMDMRSGGFNTILRRESGVHPPTMSGSPDRIEMEQHLLRNVTSFDLIIRQLSPDDAGIYKCSVAFSTTFSTYWDESASLELLIEGGTSITGMEAPKPDIVIQAVERSRFNISCFYPSTAIKEAEIRKFSSDGSVLHTIVTATRRGKTFTVQNTHSPYTYSNHESSARFRNGGFYFTLTIRFFEKEQAGDYECMLISQDKVHRKRIRVVLKRNTETLPLLRAELGSTIRLTCNTSVEHSIMKWQKFMFKSSQFEDLVSRDASAGSQYGRNMIDAENSTRFTTVYTSSSNVVSLEIVINAIARADAGIYRCLATRNEPDNMGSVTKIIVIESREYFTEDTGITWPYRHDSENSAGSPSGAHIGLPIGLSVAAVLVIIVIALGTFIFIRRRRKGLPMFGSQSNQSGGTHGETHYDNGCTIASRDSHKYNTPSVHSDPYQEHVYVSADDVLGSTERNPAYAPCYIEPLGSESPDYQEPDVTQTTRIPSGYINGGYLRPENNDQYIIDSDRQV